MKNKKQKFQISNFFSKLTPKKVKAFRIKESLNG
jgi:hypothetical protein